MKKHPYLSTFPCDINIHGALNGAVVSIPEIDSNNTSVNTSVICTTKEQILKLVKDKLDEFYKD